MAEQRDTVICELEREAFEPIADLIARAERRAVIEAKGPVNQARWDRLMDELDVLDLRLHALAQAGADTSQLRDKRHAVWQEARAVAEYLDY